MKIDFKKFWVWISSIIAVGTVYLIATNWPEIICWWKFIATKENALELATFFITALAFIAAGLAFWLQHKSLNHQIEDSKKQDIISAWQVLANKAASNSGKIEAIEFLAKQGKPMTGIDMSEKTNGERFI